MRLQPHLEREGVMFFEPSRIEAVSPVTRGQMPQVAVLPDQLSADETGFDATALIVMTQSDARSEYVELLRGELAAKETRPVHIVRLTAEKPGSRFATRGISVFRAQAWERVCS